MSYSEENVNAKLSALNETQESIVTTARWVMFHRRYAERSIKIWFDKLGTSNPAKRLNLIYLINEVAQQSKFQKREEFRTALAAVIADGTAVAYNGATNDVKGKIKRVVDVWNDREVFDEQTRDDIARKLEAIDRKRGEMRRPLMTSTNSSTAAIPIELQDLVKVHARVMKATEAMNAKKEGTSDWEDVMNSIDLSNATPVTQAKINGVHDRMIQAHAAAVESVASRKAMLDELMRIFEIHKKVMAEHESLMEFYDQRRDKTEKKKEAVANAVLGKMHLAQPWTPLEHPTGEPQGKYEEPERPQVEALTPPSGGDDDGDEYNPPDAAQNPPGTPPAMFGFEDGAEDDTANDDAGHSSKKRKLEGAFGESNGSSRAFEQDDVDDLIRSEGQI